MAGIPKSCMQTTCQQHWLCRHAARVKDTRNRALQTMQLHTSLLTLSLSSLMGCSLTKYTVLRLSFWSGFVDCSVQQDRDNVNACNILGASPGYAP
jgi:hypothetical protein